jgi:pimeloyl-ACP methyl ester carboxylesterase
VSGLGPQVRAFVSAAASVLILVAVSLVCAACGGASAVKTRTVPGQPGLQYAVGGSYLYLLCEGRGSPVVVLETGLGGGHTGWGAVQPELSRTTRVCSYDRAGLELSQLAPKQASAIAKADQLHALLAAAHVKPPYILVGQSYGGLLVRVYTARHPRDVVGIVLVDASHPDQSRVFLNALHSRGGRATPAVRAFRSDINYPHNPEGVDWTVSANQARAAGGLGDRPLIVITAGHEDWPPGLPRPVVQRLNRVWLTLQDQLAHLSTNSVHVIALHSPHYVMAVWGQPGLVIHAIRAVLDAARTHATLAPCRALFAGMFAKCVS